MTDLAFFLRHNRNRVPMNITRTDGIVIPIPALAPVDKPLLRDSPASRFVGEGSAALNTVEEKGVGFEVTNVDGSLERFEDMRRVELSADLGIGVGVMTMMGVCTSVADGGAVDRGVAGGGLERPSRPSCSVLPWCLYSSSTDQHIRRTKKKLIVDQLRARRIEVASLAKARRNQDYSRAPRWVII
jgi:hypothetical protein